MADGTTKPIEKITLGDRVAASAPEEGKSAAKPVVTLLQGEGSTKLVKITITGKKGSATGQVTATDGRPCGLSSRCPGR